MVKTLGALEIEEFMVGLILVNLAAYAIQDFVVLLMYKTFKLVGQSTLSSFIIFFLSMTALFVYMRAVPKEVAEEII